MEHTHYWLIDPPDGATSKAHCKYCPAKAEFCNWVKVKNAFSYPIKATQEVEVGRHESIYQILGV